MIEITGIPSRGGMNKDDALENLPKNDYEEGVNLDLLFGDNYLRKLKGTVDLLSQNGNCFGIFGFNDFSLLFIDDSGTHLIYKVFPDYTTELIFNHDLGLDTSVRIVDCKLIHDEILVINNGVNEPLKLNMEMASLSTYTQADFFSKSSPDGTFAITPDTGSSFDQNTTKVFIWKIGNAIVNAVIEGAVENGDFVTEYPEDLTLDLQPVYLKEVSDSEIKKAYTHQSTSDYLYINTPPLDTPVVNYVSDPSIASNKIDKQCFQFQAKYVYHDGTESAWSPISDLLIDNNETFLDNNNRISITVKHPSNYNRYAVKEVVFGVRINEGDLYEFERKDLNIAQENNLTTIRSFILSASDVSDISVFFDNNSIKIPILPDEQVSLFDRIPLKANAVEFIDNSRIVFVGIEQGMKVVEPEVSITPLYNSVPEVTPTDWIMGFRYEGEEYEYSSGGAADIRYGGHWQPKYNFFTGNIDIQLTQAYNRSNTGDGITSIGSGSDVEFAYSLMARNKEASWRSTYLYLQLSSTQTIGTEYKFNIDAKYKNPSTGAWIGSVYTEEFTIISDSTSTQDLIDKIKSTIAAHPSLNKNWSEYEGDSVYTEVIQAVDDGTSSTGWRFPSSSFEAPSEWSFEIRTGMQCVHDNPGHYHWYQIDYAIIKVWKKSTLSSIQKSLKKDASHPFAIQYYDHSGRSIGCIPIGELNLSKINSTGYLQANIGARIEIFHDPPEGAVKFKIVYAGNKTFKNFIQAIIKTVTPSGSFQEITLNLDDYNNSQGTSLVYGFTEGDVIQRLESYDGGTGEWTVLDNDETVPNKIVSQEADGTLKIYSPSTTFAEGDFVSVNTYKKESDKDDELYYEIGRTYDIINGKHEGDIQVQGGDVLATSFITGGNVKNYGDGRTYISSTSISTAEHIERLKGFFTDPPSYSGDPFYILTGKYAGTYYGSYGFDSTLGQFVVVLDIPYDSDYWNVELGPTEQIFVSWSDAPRTLSTHHGETYISSIIELPAIGDVYYRYRNVYDRFVEDYSMSDNYISNFWGKGRPSAVAVGGKKRLGVSAYYSEPYYKNTLLNGIATVFSGNFEEYDKSKGDVQRAMEHNGDLLLFHKNKVGWTTINKSVITTASGETIISKSNEVLGSVEQFHTYETGIGNQIYSLCRHGNFIYFGDNITKAFYRLAQNGIVPISEYKMKSWFNGIFNNSSTILYCFVDTANNNLVVHSKRTVVDETVDRQIIFNEDRNRWISFWDVTCEVMGFLNGNIVSFENGKFAVHIGTSNLIHGNQLTSSITMTFNEPNTIYKAWQSIMLDPVFIDMVDDADFEILIENEEGQESNLILEDFRRVGSGSWAAFRRDTTSDVDSPLINGDALRSKTLTLTLKSDSTQISKLGRIVLKYINLEQKNP